MFWKKLSPLAMLAVTLLGLQVVAAVALTRGNYALAVIGNLAPFLFGLILTFLCWRNSRGATRTVRVFWLVGATSFGIQVLSQTYFGYYEVIARQDVPGPLGDCLFFLLTVPLLAALSVCPHLEAVSRNLRFRLLDFLILLLWWLCLYSYFVIPWSLVIDDPVKFTFSNHALLLAEHCVVLAILGAYWGKSYGAWKLFYKQFFFAFLIFAAGGHLQNSASGVDLYYTGSWYDLPMAIGFVWFVILIGNARGLIPLPATPSHKQAAQGLWSARLAMLAMLSLPLLAAAGFLSSSVPASITNFRLRLICGAILVLGSLVFVRLHFSEREIARLFKMAQSSVERLQSVQARISQSQKMAALGRLAAGAAHEINNPLTAIMGYAELLHDDATLTSEEVHSADKIKEEVRRAQSAILSFRQFDGRAEMPVGVKAPAAPIE